MRRSEKDVKITPESKSKKNKPEPAVKVSRQQSTNEEILEIEKRRKKHIFPEDRV